MSRRQIRYSTILWLLLFAVPRSFLAAEEMFSSEWQVSVASASRYSQAECPSCFRPSRNSSIIFRPWMHLSSLNDVWGHPSSYASYSHYFLGTIFCTLFLIAQAPKANHVKGRSVRWGKHPQLYVMSFTDAAEMCQWHGVLRAEDPKGRPVMIFSWFSSAAVMQFAYYDSVSKWFSLSEKRSCFYNVWYVLFASAANSIPNSWMPGERSARRSVGS